MANVAKTNESAKTVKTSNNSSKEVTPKAKATAPTPIFEDKTPTMLADPQLCWDMLCNKLGADVAIARDKRDKTIIDRQFYGIARATTLALLVGGQDELLSRLQNLEIDTPQKIAELLEVGFERQAVACYFELCILRGGALSCEEFGKGYICSENVKQRGEILGSKIESYHDIVGLSKEDADAFVRRFSSSKISDKKLLEYIKDKGVTYDEAVTALSEGGQKMRLDFEELKKLGIYEINYTSNSAVKDYVYFVIK